MEGFCDSIQAGEGDCRIYFDKQGVWHQQGLTSEQLKAITGRKKELDEEERHSDLRLLLIKEKRDTPYNCMRYLFLSGKAHL